MAQMPPHPGVPGSPQQAANPQAMPGRAIREMERVDFFGRELAVVEYTESRLVGDVILTDRRREVAGLDCHCTVSSVLEAAQCSCCMGIVCRERHAVTCSHCGRQVCLACTRIIEDEAGVRCLACGDCLQALEPTPLVRVVNRLLRLVGLRPE